MANKLILGCKYLEEIQKKSKIQVFSISGDLEEEDLVKKNFYENISQKNSLKLI